MVVSIAGGRQPWSSLSSTDCSILKNLEIIDSALLQSKEKSYPERPSGLRLLQSHIQGFQPKEKNVRVKWLVYKNGDLAQTEHGIFVVYGQLNRWYVEYEAGASDYGDGIGMPLTVHGLRTADAEKADAEKYAKRLNTNPRTEFLDGNNGER